LVEQAQFAFDGKLIPVTISIGVAAYPYASIQNGLELIAVADEALYEAKRSGRNRVVMKR
jgi:two-component system cell cycle response regulator